MKGEMREKDAPGEKLPEFASQWLAQRRLGFARLEELRQQQLRNMTEAEAARIFSQLDPPRPYRLRPSSGLVEQQRWFRMLKEKLDASSVEGERSAIRDEG